MSYKTNRRTRRKFRAGKRCAQCGNVVTTNKPILADKPLIAEGGKSICPTCGGSYRDLEKTKGVHRNVDKAKGVFR